MSRRTAVLGVVLISQVTGMLIAFGLAILRNEGMPTPADLGWAALAGTLGVVGITALYRGLAVGRMGVVAPVTGVIGAVIPVCAGIVLEGFPGPVVMVGIGAALVAVVLVTRVTDGGGVESGLRFALIAGAAIGLFGLVSAQISDGHVFGPLTVLRGAEVLVLVVAIRLTRASWRPPIRLLPPLVAIGVADMTGNAFYLLAIQSGALAVASVVSSLYPVTTVILAAAILHERVTRTHMVGIALATLAIALIGLGST
jgi:drug/metabolite transporter (DMT)-like permease